MSGIVLNIDSLGLLYSHCIIRFNISGEYKCSVLNS